MTATTALDLARIMRALDGATDALGMELSRDARQRLYAAMETTTGPRWLEERAERWIAARSIVVSDASGGVTLWQAVAARWGGAYRSPAMIPSPYTILVAIEAAATQKEQAA